MFTVRTTEVWTDKGGGLAGGPWEVGGGLAGGWTLQSSLVMHPTHRCSQDFCLTMVFNDEGPCVALDGIKPCAGLLGLIRCVFLACRSFVRSFYPHGHHAVSVGIRRAQRRRVLEDWPIQVQGDPGVHGRSDASAGEAACRGTERWKGP